KKYGRTDKAIDKLVRNQISKNSLNGFATSFGGLSTMLVTLPANITSVLYVQMRMIASIALIRGYDLKDDEVQTFVYS
ncbi:EcsC family protein, partial [Staphylococcus aureus]|nr:EcsC family protein [Staphylococcus aureus]